MKCDTGIGLDYNNKGTEDKATDEKGGITPCLKRKSFGYSSKISKTLNLEIIITVEIQI